MNAHTDYRLQSLLFRALLILAVALLAWLSTVHDRRLDWTNRHSLSEASRALVQRISAVVDVEVYAERLAFRQPAVSFLERYRQAGLQLRIEYVNPSARPDRVRERGVQHQGELVILYQGGAERVQMQSGSYREQDFSRALQRLLSGRRTLLQFLSGHGERRPQGGANHDLDAWVGLLQEHGYRTQLLDFSQAAMVPDSSATLILAGLHTELLEHELQQLDRYLQQGGNLLWLTDPGKVYDRGRLMAQLGITRPAGSILSHHSGLTEDPGLLLTGPENYLKHIALERFDYLGLFPEVASIQPQPESGWTAYPLVQSGGDSWLETGSLSGHVQYDADTDVSGPLPIILALERPHPQADPQRPRQRVVVTGDGDFLSNTFIRNGGNAVLGLLLVNWLSVNSDAQPFFADIARPKDTRLNMGPRMQGAYMLGFSLALPLLLLGVGWTVQYRRRRR